MKVLITGATGFLGRRVLRRLLAAGHAVVCAGRRPPPVSDARCRWLKVDLATTSAEGWLAHLRGVDAVAQMAGVFRETPQMRFQALHVDGPKALFTACVVAGVRRVVQVSALGADARSETPFLRSKYEADRHLLGLPLDGCVVQPSLIYGPDGTSSRRLLAWASAPWLALPAGGRQRLQPVHVDDAAEAVHELLEAPALSWRGRRIALVGPQALTLQAYLLALRRGLRLPPPLGELRVPAPAVAALARFGERLPGALLDRAAWAMLQRGSTADAYGITRLLGRSPRPVAAFILPEEAAALRLQARWAWLQPVLRLSLAVVWLASAVVSLGVYPQADSLALLAEVGLPPAWQRPALWGASALDALLGLLTLRPGPRPRRLWALQALLITVYSALIAWRLPGFWAHPFGPLVKNLPMLAVLLALACLAPRTPDRPAG